MEKKAKQKIKAIIDQINNHNYDLIGNKIIENFILNLKDLNV